jgi:hypothetical protein
LISLHDPRALVAVVSPLGSGWLEDDLLKSERLNFSSGTEVQITVAEGHRRHPRARVRTEESHRIGVLNFRGSTFQAFDPNSSRGTSDDRHRSIGSQGLPTARRSITGALIDPIPAPQLNGKSARRLSFEVVREDRKWRNQPVGRAQSIERQAQSTVDTMLRHLYNCLSTSL